MMRKIEYVGDGEDQIDGSPIKDGEMLRVRFPDGFVRVVAARVIAMHGSRLDHGHIYPTIGFRAYCYATAYGSQAMIPLVGLEAERP